MEATQNLNIHCWSNFYVAMLHVIYDESVPGTDMYSKIHYISCNWMSLKNNNIQTTIIIKFYLFICKQLYLTLEHNFYWVFKPLNKNNSKQNNKEYRTNKVPLGQYQVYR